MITLNTSTSFWASAGSVDIFGHLEDLATFITHEREQHGYDEPSRITTDWRDDGFESGEHVGWVSVVEWPLELSA